MAVAAQITKIVEEDRRNFNWVEIELPYLLENFLGNRDHLLRDTMEMNGLTHGSRDIWA